MPPKKMCSYCKDRLLGSAGYDHTVAKCPHKKKEDNEIYLNVWYRIAVSLKPTLTSSELPRLYPDMQWTDVFQHLLTRTGPLDEAASNMIKSALGGTTSRAYLYYRRPPLTSADEASALGSSRHRDSRVRSASAIRSRAPSEPEALDANDIRPPHKEIEDVEEFSDITTRVSPRTAARVYVRDTPPHLAKAVRGRSPALTRGVSVLSKKFRVSETPEAVRRGRSFTSSSSIASKAVKRG
jgi:hypothetical protein